MRNDPIIILRNQNKDPCVSEDIISYLNMKFVPVFKTVCN